MDHYEDGYVGVDEIVGAEADGDGAFAGWDQALEIIGADELDQHIGGYSGSVQDLLNAVAGAPMRRRRPLPPPPGGGGQRPIIVQPARPQRPQQPQLVNRRPREVRDEMLGFDSVTDIPPGETRPVIARPQVIFRGERLVVPSSIAGDFVIEDIRVGNRPMFAASGGNSALVFSEGSTHVRLQMTTAQPGIDIVLLASNTSGAARRFRATLIGKGAE